MSTILLHISDMHFGGSHARDRAEAVLRTEAEVKPDAVVCSGDLVEWAEAKGAWQEVRAFFQKLVAPLLVIPGNHDLPRINVIARIFSPLASYRRHVHEEVNTTLELKNAVIVGLSTARFWSLDRGHISREQIEWARQALSGAKQGRVKVIAMHQALRGICTGIRRHQVYGAQRALRSFADMGADLVLSGHSHFAHSEHIVADSGRSLVWVQAGATGSSRFRRTREQQNSLNVIRAKAGEVIIECWRYMEKLKDFSWAETTTHQLLTTSLKATS
jgi:3',5'-cyclic AMP phosphodiesterase CpdA